MNNNEVLWTQLEELDVWHVVWQRLEWEPPAPSAPSGWRWGGPMLAGFMWTHTFNKGPNTTLLFQNGLLIYIHQGLKGPVMSAEIEVLTATFDSFSLTLVLWLCRLMWHVRAFSAGEEAYVALASSAKINTVRGRHFPNKQ